MIARFSLAALDAADPRGLAEFYSQITGWPVDPDSDDEWIELQSDGGPTIAFQLAPDHEPPTWPTGGHPQQLHLDFDVDDLDAAEARVLAIGATKADTQPGRTWRVYIDPAGHPFCFVLAG